MVNDTGYIKHIDSISRKEFTRLFAEGQNLEAWFTEKERSAFRFPWNSGSLGARYLIKKRICEQINMPGSWKDIEITNLPSGGPGIQFGEKIWNELSRSGIQRIACSISHSRNYIATMVIFML